MYKGEIRYNLGRVPTGGLGAAAVDSDSLTGQKLQVGNRYRIEFEARGIQGGAVPWGPDFTNEIETNMAARGYRVRVAGVNQGTRTPTSGSSTLDFASNWIPGASSLLPSSDLLENFTFSIDLDVLGLVDTGMSGLGIVPLVAVYIGIGIVAAVVALSVLAPSIVVKSVSNLGKALGEGVTAALKGLGPVGLLAVAGAVFLWLKFSKKGQAVKNKVFG